MGREYMGTGGLRLHLDEPLPPQMADQVARGHLVPVDDNAVESEQADSGPAPVEKPAATAKVGDWRAYAISLGMPGDEAAAATKADLQEYVQVAEGDGSGE
ncbi:hypothetical protein ACIHCX_03445 [Streptomyces sp. NPDC052043]|uniref:hypothetical protein n=1 Tax=Streptomyces sp. NPDC052043 TaxID=3365684 RepID=UPI0037D02627